MRQGSVFDRIALLGSSVGIAMPNWLGLVSPRSSAPSWGCSRRAATCRSGVGGSLGSRTWCCRS
ncbi:hypothetical protein HBB16_00880 [Pseudonocardia sp. MCCB 268]|nr:hypothetical protein [Pseudonocardia cytotoxica]